MLPEIIKINIIIKKYGMILYFAGDFLYNTYPRENDVDIGISSFGVLLVAKTKKSYISTTKIIRI